MGQSRVGGIETVAVAEDTGVAELIRDTEGYDLALLVDNLEGQRLQTLLGIVLYLVGNELESQIVGKTIGVDLYGSCKGLAGIGVLVEVLDSVDIKHLDTVPGGGNLLFPACYLLGELVVVGRKGGETLGLGSIEALDVVLDHALHGVLGSDVTDRTLDILDPLGRVALGVLGKVERYDLVLEHGVDSGGVELVLLRLIGEGALLGESPAGFLVETVAFIPPAVEHREVEHTVHLGLLARCTRSLERQ